MTFDLSPFRHLYPFESRYLDRGGLRMHYLDEGRGDPVVALHGNPTWSFYYRDLVLALRGDHRVIVPDHIGMGLSDKPGDEAYSYRLKSRVDDFELLLDRLGIREDVTLILHDWGGAIGMAWAVRHPERVKRIVFLNTAAFLPPKSKPIPISLQIVRNTPVGALLVRGFNAFARGATTMATKKGLSAEIRSAYVAPYNSWANRIATLRFVEDIPLAPGDPSYGLVADTHAGLTQFRDRPILICWGMQDFVFDPDYLEAWRAIYPDAEVRTYADAGHYVLEDAGTEVIAEIRRFLARKSAPALAP